MKGVDVRETIFKEIIDENSLEPKKNSSYQNESTSQGLGRINFLFICKFIYICYVYRYIWLRYLYSAGKKKMFPFQHRNNGLQRKEHHTCIKFLTCKTDSSTVQLY